MKTIMHSAAVIFTAMAILPSAVGQQAVPQSVQACDTISLAKPGNGAAYRGDIRNSDYRFSARIPEGLVGWGAGVGAPFHGFTIYLDTAPKIASCIQFTIETHVDLPDEIQRSHSAPDEKRVKVGNRLASVTSSSVLS